MPPKRKSTGSSKAATASSPVTAPSTPSSSKRKAAGAQPPSSGGASYSTAKSFGSSRTGTRPVRYVELNSSGEEELSESDDEDEASDEDLERGGKKGKGKGKGKAAVDDDNFSLVSEELSADVEEDASEEITTEESEEDEMPSSKRRKASNGKAKARNGTSKQASDHDGDDGTSKSTPSRKTMAQKAKDSGQKRTVIQLAQAPNEKLPPGRISKHLLKFLDDMKDPAKNDRDWFQQNDAVYRYIWKNFNDFIATLVPKLVDEVDETLPDLPPKDIVHRIYRDVRFSSDKTPYKKGLSASFSRGGRKGFFAGYYLEIRSGRSFVAGGRWSPIKEHLVIFRNHLLNDTPEGKKLKEILNAPAFVKLFGPAKPGGKSGKQRSSVFGFEDELKVAPKIEGVDKSHPQIAWLKLKSFIVSTDLPDEVVLANDFMEQLMDIMKVMQPLVEHLNDMIYPPPTPPPSDTEEEGEEGAEEEKEDEEE